MATTYDATLATARDRLRSRLGDTGESGEWLLADETIAGWLAYEGADEAATLVTLARALIAKVSQEPDTAALGGGVAFSWKPRLDYWHRIVLEGGGSGGGFVAVLTPAMYPHDPYAEWLTDAERAP